MNLLRMSHLLHLKELFAQNRGKIPLQLRFLVENALLATLHIDSNWGVSGSEELLAALKALPPTRAVQ